MKQPIKGEEPNRLTLSVRTMELHEGKKTKYIPPRHIQPSEISQNENRAVFPPFDPPRTWLRGVSNPSFPHSLTLFSQHASPPERISERAELCRSVPRPLFCFSLLPKPLISIFRFFCSLSFPFLPYSRKELSMSSLVARHFRSVGNFFPPLNGVYRTSEGGCVLGRFDL